MLPDSICDHHCACSSFPLIGTNQIQHGLSVRKIMIRSPGHNANPQQIDWNHGHSWSGGPWNHVAFAFGDTNLRKAYPLRRLASTVNLTMEKDTTATNIYHQPIKYSKNIWSVATITTISLLICGCSYHNGGMCSVAAKLAPYTNTGIGSLRLLWPVRAILWNLQQDSLYKTDSRPLFWLKSSIRDM